MYIYSVGSLHNEIENDTLPNLKELVKSTCGMHIRRTDRFIQMALIGSHQCAKNQTLANNTGIYLASSQGAKANISKSLEMIYKNKEPLMPLNFINMVGNSACFYVAKSLSIHGANLFFTHNHFAFENALEIALLDIETGVSDSALVGTIDECITPLHHHRTQLKISPDKNLAEGTHWWLVSQSPPENQTPLAKIEGLSFSPSIDALSKTLAEIVTQSQGKKFSLAIGKGLHSEMILSINKIIHAEIIIDYSKELGFYESINGYALTRLLNDKDAFPDDYILIHIDANDSTCFSCLWLSH